MIVIRTPRKLLEELGLQPARVPIPAQAVRAHNFAQRPVREYSDSRRRVVGHILLLLVPENPCCLGSSTVPINLRGDGPSKLVLLLRSPPVFSSTPRPGFYVALVSLALFPADRGLPFPSRAGLAAPPAARHDARGLGLSLVQRGADLGGYSAPEVGSGNCPSERRYDTLLRLRGQSQRPPGGVNMRGGPQRPA